MTGDTLLILRLSALGDILHTVPAVEALRTAHPQAPIVWIVENPYRELVELIAPVDRVITVATKRWRRNAFAAETRHEALGAFSAMRAAARGATAVDFQGLYKSAFLGFVSGAAQRYGFDRQAIKEKGATLLLNRSTAVDVTQHVITQNLQLAAALGADPSRVETPGLSRLADDPDGTLALLIASHPMILNPGAGAAGKHWPTERFAALARELRLRFDQRPLVVWGPGERTLAESIAASGDAVLAPATTLRQLAFLVSHARLVVASDTGPLHLAAAFQTPVVGLFGPTNPHRNGPWGQIERCVETYSTDRRMESISVGAVMARAGEVIESTRRIEP